MAESGAEDREVLEFILEKIDSVPHLEALLLLWNTRPQPWLPEAVGGRLYIKPPEARRLLEDLSRAGLIAAPPNQYYYQSKSEQHDSLMERVDLAYRRQLVLVSTIIHSKGSASVRDFARAFHFRKDGGGS